MIWSSGYKFDVYSRVIAPKLAKRVISPNDISGYEQHIFIFHKCDILEHFQRQVFSPVYSNQYGYKVFKKG